jgi:uncharacterized protein GlcG (DUF336 family)
MKIVQPVVFLTGFTIAQIASAQTPPPPAPQPPAAKGPSLAAAMEAANAAISNCTANGYTVAVSIVDSAGVTKVLLAADGARARAVESSTKKAVTALTLKMSTAEVAEKIKTDEALAARLTADPTLFARPGGLLLKAGDEIIGAIGVGGAPGAEKDEACATAAIDKVKAQLK